MIDPQLENKGMLETKRLRLREWTDADREPLASMNADPAVMEYFPSVLSREESDAMFDRVVAHFQKHQFGFWIMELPGIDPFAGILGLGIPRFESHFTPCIEIGWRIKPEYWGRGLAPEGARLCLDYGFHKLNQQQIVAMTTVDNRKSRRVMEKLGMHWDPADDFDHPLVPDGHRYVRHVLYRINRAEFLGTKPGA